MVFLSLTDSLSGSEGIGETMISNAPFLDSTILVILRGREGEGGK